MITVGVRELKARLSHYLRRVRRGERLVVTARGRPIAVLGPTLTHASLERVEQLLSAGLAHWDGGKPQGARRPPRIVGRSVSDTVIEERR